ncbi:MAG: site-2 protease family protein [Actinomycetota bacterium]
MRFLTETRAGRAIVLVTLIALIVADLRRAAVLGLVFMIDAVATVVHELGHLLAARTVGYRVDELRIGHGRRIWRREIRGVPVVLRALPFTGHVRFSSGTRPARSWKDVAVAAGGPAANIGVVVISLAILPGLWGLPIYAVNGIVAIANLVPFRSKVGPSDGLQILRLITSTFRPAGAWR